MTANQPTKAPALTLADQVEKAEREIEIWDGSIPPHAARQVVETYRGVINGNRFTTATGKVMEEQVFADGSTRWIHRGILCPYFLESRDRAAYRRKITWAVFATGLVLGLLYAATLILEKL